MSSILLVNMCRLTINTTNNDNTERSSYGLHSNYRKSPMNSSDTRTHSQTSNQRHPWTLPIRGHDLNNRVAIQIRFDRLCTIRGYMGNVNTLYVRSVELNWTHLHLFQNYFSPFKVTSTRPVISWETVNTF